MRKKIYLLIVLVFAALVFYKASVIQKKEKKEIISIAEEWKKNGKPVDVAAAGRGEAYCYEKISGVLKDRNTIESDVTQGIVRNLAPGQRFTAVENGNTITGRVEQISGSRDMVTGLFKVRLRTDRALDFSLGTIIVSRVNIKTVDNVIKIPNAAVVIEKDGEYCWVVKDKRVTRRKIKTGLTCDGHVQVLSGVSAGEQVCVNGILSLNGNDRVVIRKEVSE